MHDIKMHTKAKGREPVDRRNAGLYRAFGEVKATARGRNMLQQQASVCPRGTWCDDLISQARQGSLVSNSLESSQIPAPVEGVVLILAGDDAPCRPEL